jgi:phosphoribosyl 1,2-cyclic phosphate phosphodiesterase
MLDCLKINFIACGERIDADGLGFTALDVQHAPGTIGLLIETLNGRRIAYLPDTGPLLRKTARLLREVDVLILDATFWGRSIMPEAHQSVESAVHLGLELNAREIYLTHLSMHHDRPVTNQELQDFLSDYGKHIHIAHDGLRLDI